MKRHTRLCVVVLLGCFWCSGVTVGSISFEPRTYWIQGLPTGFLVQDVAVLGKAEGHGLRVVLLGIYGHGDKVVTCTEVADLASDSGKVLDTVFEKPLSSPPSPGGVQAFDFLHVQAVDFDNDGNKEIFVLGDKADNMLAFKAEGTKYREIELPFPRLSWPKLAWLDYNGDGWIDLFLAGDIETPDPTSQLVPPLYRTVARLYKNDHGKFVFERDLLRDSLVSGAQAVDLDGDGKDDLAVFPRTSVNRTPLTVHLYFGRDQDLVEARTPLSGFDDLLEMSGAHIATGDLDRDGIPEILLTGSWKEKLGTKSFITLLYHRIGADPRHFMLDYDRQTSDLPDFKGDFAVADLDGDGYPDVFGSGLLREGKFGLVCIENQAGRLAPLDVEKLFPDKGRLRPEEYGFFVNLLYDLDGDGKPDILLVPSVSGKPHVLLHNTSETAARKGEKRPVAP